MYIVAIYFQRAGKKTNGLIIDIPQVVMGEAIKKTLETSIDVGQHPVIRILRYPKIRGCTFLKLVFIIALAWLILLRISSA